MLYGVLFALFILNVNGEIIRYDSYTGAPISDAEYDLRVEANTTFWCINEVQTCDPNEWRRVDGSCNNLRNPARGASHTPTYRILPPIFDKGYEPRRAKDGQPLPPPRYLRTSLLAEGKVPDREFTQLATHFLAFFMSDVDNDLEDTVKIITKKPSCCQRKDKNDYECIPNKIPNDDPVHRFSNVRCFNLTKPDTFQSKGCLLNEGIPERIISSTPLFDLSSLYGNLLESLNSRGRKFIGGLLKFDLVDGRVWPPTTDGKNDICLQNHKPVETRCHNTPEKTTNSKLGVNLFSIWFWRHHNVIAKELSQINPCWNDDRLFYTARDINIAAYTQTLYYELMPLLMGKENLLNDGVISHSPGFRDNYNEKLPSMIASEFLLATRWFQTIQAGAVKMYDQKGFYLKEFPIVNVTLRTGFLAKDNNLDYITQGSFRQSSGKIDYVVDPDIAEVGLGSLQRALDILTNDLTMNRYLGIQPYVKYKQFCFYKPNESFDDLLDAIDPERVEMLKDRYKDVQDIDLLAGLWMERKKAGGNLPPTLYCLIKEQLLRSIASDRHWYERKDRPHAFTFAQLAEIRKVTVSRFLCNVGDKVTKIQPHGFLKAAPGNEICDCKSLPKISFEPWRDNSCK